MSASSSYRTPAHVVPGTVRWHGPERRAQDPVNRLGRALDGICRNASDAFEVAAHLEALGFDAERSSKEFGVRDTFALARELYRRVPRRQPLPRARALPAVDPLRWLLTVAALLFTAGAGIVAHGYAWPAVLWLLVWSQIGAVLLQRARGNLPDSSRGGLVALLAILGGLGLAASYLIVPFGAPTALISLTWWGVALSLWSERVRRGLAILAGTALAAIGAWAIHAPLGIAAAIAAGLPLALLRPSRAELGPRALLRWTSGQLGAVLVPAAYGLGQGLLLLHLVRHSDVHALVGLGLFAAIVLASEPVLYALLRWMRGALWRGDMDAGYATMVRWRFLLYAGGYLALPAVLAGLWGLGIGGRWPPEMLVFALFGVSLVLALVALALGQPREPAVLFLCAGVLVVLGVPVLPVLTVLALATLRNLLGLAREVPRYAVYLL